MAGSAVGSESAFGFGEEVAWGTPVAPTRWPEIKSESITLTQNTIQSSGMRPGTPGSRSVAPGSRRAISTRHASGDLTMEYLSQGMLLLLKHLLGSVPGTTLTTAQLEATPAYKHTFKLGPLDEKGLTLQKLIRNGAHDNILALTYPGAKLTAGEFSLADNLLQLVLSFDAKDELTAFAAGEPTYGTGRPFSFMQGTLKFDDVVVAKANEPTLKIENAIATEGFYLGNGGTKDEQTQNGPATITGSVNGEVVDRAIFYDRWRADDSFSYELSFEGAVIDGLHRESLTITCPDVRLLGESPTIGGPENITVAAPWQAFADDLGTSPITIEVVTRDVTVS